MDFFDLLKMVGGLALFLYGMNLLGDGLSQASGGRLERILEKLTNNPIKAVLMGSVVTGVIQSSTRGCKRNGSYCFSVGEIFRRGDCGKSIGYYGQYRQTFGMERGYG